MADVPRFPDVASRVSCPMPRRSGGRYKRLRSANGPVAVLSCPPAPAPTRGDTANAPDLDSITIG